MNTLLPPPHLVCFYIYFHIFKCFSGHLLIFILLSVVHFGTKLLSVHITAIDTYELSYNHHWHCPLSFTYLKFLCPSSHTFSCPLHGSINNYLEPIFSNRSLFSIFFPHTSVVLAKSLLTAGEITTQQIPIGRSCTVSNYRSQFSCSKHSISSTLCPSYVLL